MKKFLLLVAAAVTVSMLSVPMAFAVPSPTEPDRPPVEVNDPDVPLTEIDDPNAPLARAEAPAVSLPEELMEIEDTGVPLAFVPAPQTGVTGLSGTETLTLAAVASALSGAVMLIKARKQTGSGR